MEIIVRLFQKSDRDAVKEIAASCFDGVSMDQNIEERFGLINGLSWRDRKKRHIEEDLSANETGLFVAEAGGRVVGYVTTRLDAATRIGSIPNLSVLIDYRGLGIGKRLLLRATEYFEEHGMEYARIETLEQNAIGARLYPRMGFEEFARQIHFIKKLSPVVTRNPS